MVVTWWLQGKKRILLDRKFICYLIPPPFTIHTVTAFHRKGAQKLTLHAYALPSIRTQHHPNAGQDKKDPQQSIGNACKMNLMKVISPGHEVQRQRLAPLSIKQWDKTMCQGLAVLWSLLQRRKLLSLVLSHSTNSRWGTSTVLGAPIKNKNQISTKTLLVPTYEYIRMAIIVNYTV